SRSSCGAWIATGDRSSRDRPLPRSGEMVYAHSVFLERFGHALSQNWTARRPQGQDRGEQSGSLSCPEGASSCTVFFVPSGQDFVHTTVVESHEWDARLIPLAS